MAGEQRRLGRHNIAEPVFESGSDAGIELLPPFA
jgi:hypothetical protein